MSTEVYGLFESREEAKSAEKALLDANFSHGEIEYRDIEEFLTAGLAQDAVGERIFLVVTAPDPSDQKRAYEILKQSGAQGIDEQEDRYRANRLIMDPDYSEEVSDVNPSVTGRLSS